MTIKLGEGGALHIPSQALAELGWKIGADLELRVVDGVLLAQKSTAEAELKQEARKLADSFRELSGTLLSRLVGAPGGASAAAQTPAPVDPVPVSPQVLVGEPSTNSVGLHSYRGIFPTVGERVYLAPGSTLMGDVTIGNDSSFWPGSVARGDIALVRVGDRCNVQDGAVLHVAPDLPCILGNDVTVGHQATVHACTIGNHTIIGIHAVVLDGAVVGDECIIAAGAVVPPGMVVPDRSMVMGVPGKVVRTLSESQLRRCHWNSDSYVQVKAEYLAEPERTSTSRPNPVAPAQPAAAEPVAPSLPTHRVPRAAGRIDPDGALDDPGWSGIPPLSCLVHSGTGEAPTMATEVRVCWDDENLYLCFSCKDTDIWGHCRNRDEPLYDEEVVEFFLCPTGNLVHYFEFEISPANVVFDAKVFSPEGDRRSILVDKEWDALGLRTGVRLSGKLNDRSSPDIGWIAEVALPFRDLGLTSPPRTGDSWRANFYRIERGEVTEFTAWSPNFREPADFHVPAYFGTLVFDGPEDGI